MSTKIRVSRAVDNLDPMELKPYPGNSKTHTAKQIDTLVRSIRNVGFNDPIAVDEDNVVLEGHGRLLAAKKLGLVKVPVIRVTGMTEAQKKAYVISHNQIGFMTGFEEDVLSVELGQLQDMEFDLSVLGFKEEELDNFLEFAEDQEELEDLVGDASERLGSVFELSNQLRLGQEEWAEPYDFPKLRMDRMGEAPEDGFNVWIGKHRTTDDGRDFFYLFGSDSTMGLPPDRTTIAFYVDDMRFERVWKNLQTYTTKFMMSGVKCLVSPNFSVMAGMPRAMKIYQTYRCRYMARYWQECGINVIPDLEFGDMEDVEFTCTGLPEGAPVIATQIQAYNGTDTEREDEIRQGYALALEKLKPLKLLVYAGDPGLRLGKEICERAGVEFVGVLNRAAHMRGDVAKQEDVRPF